MTTTDDKEKRWSPLEEELCKALCEGPDFEKADSLLRAGANPNKMDADYGTVCGYALENAVRHADVIVRFLLGHGLDPRKCGGDVGTDALCSLIWHGDPAVMRAVKLLLEAGADPSLPVVPGETDESVTSLWEGANFNFNVTDGVIDAVESLGIAACLRKFEEGKPISRFSSFHDAAGKRVQTIKLLSWPEGEGRDGCALRILRGEESFTIESGGKLAICCDGATLIVRPDLTIYCDEAELEEPGTAARDVSHFFPNCIGRTVESINYVLFFRCALDGIIVLDLGNASLWARFHATEEVLNGIKTVTRQITTVQEREAVTAGEREEMTILAARKISDE